MLCKSYRKISSLLFIALAVSSCSAQNPAHTEILRKPEAYQRAFVAAFLQSPSCKMEGYPPTSDHCDDFRFLVNAKDWVVPLTEATMVGWLSDPQANKQNINHIMRTISHTCSNTDVLEFIARAFKDSPDLREWLGTVIREGYGVPDPNFITYYYYALNSSNPAIREVAEEEIPPMLNDPNRVILQTWGEGLIIRYGHEPTSLELLTDPILKIARVGNVIHPEDLQRSLADSAKKAYERKQVKDRQQRR